MTNKWLLLAAAPLVFIDGLHLRTKSSKSNSHNVITTSGNATATASSAAAMSSGFVVGFNQQTRTPVFETN
jgi:hypothetical protein